MSPQCRLRYVFSRAGLLCLNVTGLRVGVVTGGLGRGIHEVQIRLTRLVIEQAFFGCHGLRESCYIIAGDRVASR